MGLQNGCPTQVDHFFIGIFTIRSIFHGNLSVEGLHRIRNDGFFAGGQDPLGVHGGSSVVPIAGAIVSGGIIIVFSVHGATMK